MKIDSPSIVKPFVKPFKLERPEKDKDTQDKKPRGQDKKSPSIVKESTLASRLAKARAITRPTIDILA